LKTVPNLDHHFVDTVLGHAKRLARLEGWAQAQPPMDICAPFPGPIATATTPRFYFPSGSPVVPSGSNLVMGLVATLDTAGSSDTTVQLLKNGSAVSGSSTTLGSGVNSVTTPVIVMFDGPYTDYLQVEITAAGTGAAGLNVHVQWRH
jgi:hypothetical protein